MADFAGFGVCNCRWTGFPIRVFIEVSGRGFRRGFPSKFSHQGFSIGVSHRGSPSGFPYQGFLSVFSCSLFYRHLRSPLTRGFRPQCFPVGAEVAGAGFRWRVSIGVSHQGFPSRFPIKVPCRGYQWGSPSKFPIGVFLWVSRFQGHVFRWQVFEG